MSPLLDKTLNLGNLDATKLYFIFRNSIFMRLINERITRYLYFLLSDLPFYRLDEGKVILNHSCNNFLREIVKGFNNLSFTDNV